MPLAPVILAAGKSERMGTPKPYIKLDGKTFLEIIASKLREAGYRGAGAIVFNEKHQSLIKTLSLFGFTLISNYRQEQGQLYSLQLALSNLPEKSTGILMCLADHPFVKKETYSRLLDTHESFPGKIILPIYGGKRGHPPLFPENVFPDILQLSLNDARGAKAILESHPERILEVSVNDPAILADLDTPEDLFRFRGLESSGENGEETE